VPASRGPCYTIIATVDGEHIEAGYVSLSDDGTYNDDLTVTADATRPGDDTRRAWYTLTDAHRAPADTDEP
jgi:hypothetical protein